MSARGGKRLGAGRPKLQDPPKPVSWRPSSEAQRQKYLALGGAKWIKKMLDAQP